MRDKSSVLQRLTESVCDGTPVDWDAEVSVHEDLAARLQRLRLVESISQAHQSLPGASPSTSPSPNSMEATVDQGDLHAPSARNAWGPLELIEKLGEGGFGEVWRAREPKLQREVALKLRKKRGNSDGLFAGRFLEEARKLARIDHENVLDVYGADEHDGREGLWTKLVEGKTLEDELAERGPFSDGEAALVGIDLCRALAAVHGADLIHRDVKTDNAMRAQGGKIILMDFGSVTDVPRDGETSSGHEISGTPLAMAPEALRGTTLDASADVYSLGVLLYRLVTGNYPIEAESFSELVEMHRKNQRTPLRDHRPDLSAGFVQVVEQALSADRQERYQSAGAMEGALMKAMGTTASEEARPPAVESTRSTARSFRWWQMAAALATVVVAVWIGKLMLAPGEEDSAPLKAPGAPTMAAFEVETAILREDRGGEGGDIRLAKGGRVQPGDKLFLEIQGSDAMHVYVLNADDAGEEWLLFPLRGFETQNPLPAHAEHRLPGTIGGEDFSWTVTSAGGTERFLVVASREPMELLEEQIARHSDAEPGRPIRMQNGTVPRLRGVGGIDISASSGAAEGGRLSELAEAARELGGVHVEIFELDNPRP